MKNRFRFFAFLIVTAFSSLAYANDFEAALSSETAQFTLRSDSSVIGWGGAELGLGVFYNDNSDVLAQVGLVQRRQASEQLPLTAGVGVKLYLGHLDKLEQDIAALSIGGELRYTIPGTMPMSAYAILQYAPQITSFSDTKNLTDFNIGFQVEIVPQTSAFIGYRKIQTDLKGGGDFNLTDDHLHIGVRLTF